MANTTTKRIAQDVLKIFSNQTSVSHQPRNGEIYWLWEKSPYEETCYIEKTREEIKRELRESRGLRKLFEMGCLVIKDEEIVNEFRLNCLDEYIKNINELREFINSCSITDFEDYLQYAPEAMIDNIALICTETELTDIRKIRLYKEYTGKDLAEFYEDNANTSTVENVEPQAEKKVARKKKIIKE